MAGHSKWSQIKRKKAANDKQRAKIISKHLRAIQAAVRAGGSGDIAANLGLKNTLAAAKSDSVPQDNIDRAIERALGNSEDGQLEEVQYEGYGPVGVALLIEALTDNRNRTIADVRHVFNKHGGNMSGGTAWQFDSKGIIVIEDNSERIQELALELGAEDWEIEEDAITLYTDPTELYELVEGFEQAGYTVAVSQLTRLPQNETALDSGDADKVLRMIDALEDLDDVQNVYSNADLENAAVAS
jgi:YebC/PmpR family DNA-binding regulatory protein